jgi:hypothetical protein
MVAVPAVAMLGQDLTGEREARAAENRNNSSPRLHAERRIEATRR